LTPHFAGSTSFSVTSTSFRKGFFASCLRWKMLMASAVTPTAAIAVTSAMTT
jgi:hypothetical protein